MKKLFTLLTLLVAIVTGAQAQTVTKGSYTTRTISANNLTSTWAFDVVSGSAVNGSTSGQTDNEMVLVANSSNSNIKYQTSKYLTCKGGSSVYLPVPAGSAGTVSLVMNSSSDSRWFQLFINGTAGTESQRLWSKLGDGTDGKKGPQSFSFTSSDITTYNGNTYLHFTDNNAEMKVTSMTITLTTGTYAKGPQITTQPQGASYVTGQTIAALTVEATPSTATFQWYTCDDADKTNAQPIENATEASYTPTAAGFYYVAVTAGGVTVNSDVAQITVSAATAPTISVSGAPAEAVKVGAEVILTATATGVPTPTVAWYDNADTTEPVATGATFTVPTTNAGTSVYYAVASNSEGNATSDLQTITVKEQVAKPTITPNGAYFEEAQIVELACTTDGATIQYSTDGGSTWTNYTAALTFTATTPLQAKATKTGCIDSETASANFTLFEKAELASVSAETTWDFTGWNQELQLSDTTTPTNTDEYTYSDIALINSSITLPSGFNGEAMMFKGQYPVRSKKAQAGTWTIKTTKPGTLAVTFSDTGSKGDNPPKRYLNINGTNTEYYTQRTGSSSDQKTVTVDISAGENVITGMGEDGTSWQAICLYKIVYTPIDVDIVLDESGNNATTIAANDGQTNQKVFVNRKLSTQYYNTLFLPFAMSLEQMKAAFGEGAQVATFTGMNSETQFGFGNVTAMEANVPYLVKPAQEVNGFTVEGVTISNTAAAGVVSGGYSMVGTYDTFTNGSSTSGGSIGISIGGSSSSSNEIYYFANTGKIKKLTSTGSIKGLRAFMVKLPAGKTSVETIVSNAGIKFGGAGGGSARARQDFVLYLDDDNTTTGIEAIENGQMTIDNDAPAYNLAGQKIGKGYKGIVIINGKKVVK